MCTTIDTHRRTFRRISHCTIRTILESGFLASNNRSPCFFPLSFPFLFFWLGSFRLWSEDVTGWPMWEKRRNHAPLKIVTNHNMLILRALSTSHTHSTQFTILFDCIQIFSVSAVCFSWNYATASNSDSVFVSGLAYHHDTARSHQKKRKTLTILKYEHAIYAFRCFDSIILPFSGNSFNFALRFRLLRRATCTRQTLFGNTRILLRTQLQPNSAHYNRTI